MRPVTRNILIAIAVIVLALAGWLYFIKGYVSVKRRHPVPVDMIYKAEIPGMKNVRAMLDPLKGKHSKISKEIYRSGLTEARFNNPDVHMLAISGGGANGAYGAGILCGWTETKERPQFDIVTGVSTGALIAPASFIGPSYDTLIKDIYTNISDADIVKQNLINFFFEGRPSILDTQPLRSVLKSAVTMKVLEDVAREHAKGRRLYIATANLDARRLVIWDMGAIASLGTPPALELFRNIMLASASIPVAFPPVMFKVEVDGKVYDEMHVDGSTATQVFGSLMMLGHSAAKKKKVNIYVIRNGKMADMPAWVSLKLWDIAGAAFSMMITWQSYGDLYRFSTLARYERSRFYFTCIPYEFNEPRSSEFDLDYMRKLFYRGFRMGQAGKNWFRQVGAKIEPSAPGK